MTDQSPIQTAADPSALRAALADSTVRPHDLAANLGVP